MGNNGEEEGIGEKNKKEMGKKKGRIGEDGKGDEEGFS